jgi:hypothetical protein
MFLYTGCESAGPGHTLVSPSLRPRRAFPRRPKHEFQTAPEGLRKGSPTPACEI